MVEAADGAPGDWAGGGDQRLAVVGAGLMGAGIAQAAASHGITVELFDIAEEALERGVDQIRSSLARVARTGELTEQPQAILDRIQPGTDLKSAVSRSPLVIEAAPEVLSLKHDLFQDLDRLAPDGAVLASNTSQLSITLIAGATQRPEDVIGLHFFNPVPVMPLVEVIPGLLTRTETLARGLDFCRAISKETVLARDVQGFVASRGSLALQLECQRIIEEGVATAEDIDKTFRLGFGHPMGPMELGDYVGLDTLLRIAEAMHATHGERFRPPHILRQLVAAGHHGRKSGHGFYDYSDPTHELRG